MDHLNAINDAIVQSPAKGPVTLVISLFSAILTFISLHNAQVLVSICAGVIASISGIMAICYYRLAMQEKKESLRKQKNQ